MHERKACVNKEHGNSSFSAGRTKSTHLDSPWLVELEYVVLASRLGDFASGWADENQDVFHRTDFGLGDVYLNGQVQKGQSRCEDEYVL